MDQRTVEPTVEIEAPEPTSIDSHKAAFGPGAEKQVEIDVEEPAPDPLKPIRPVDQQRRDQGKFAEGRQRMKAKDAVERINQLTGRAKTAEEKLAAAEAKVQELERRGAPPQQIARAEQRVEQAEQRVQTAAPSTFSEPEPDENDPKFAGDYGKYLRAAAAWEGRKAYHEAREGERTKERESQQARQQEQFASAFLDRADKAKARLGAEFEATLRDWDAPWLQRNGEPYPGAERVDEFIKLHPGGMDVLHYLRFHPEDIDALRGMTPPEQSERLSLIHQRLASPTPSKAGVTTAAGRPQAIVLAPKPPTVVRTEAQRHGEMPPPTDGSLSIAEHQKAFGRSRR